MLVVPLEVETVVLAKGAVVIYALEMVMPDDVVTDIKDAGYSVVRLCACALGRQSSLNHR